MAVATRRRLEEELGIEAELEFVYKFSYHAAYGKVGSENEVCSVYLGRTTQQHSANSNEIAKARYISRGTLQRELQTRPEDFTPWFRMEWERLSGEYAERLAEYTKRQTGK